MKVNVNQSQLEVVQGDITLQDTEAVGNAANSALAGVGAWMAPSTGQVDPLS